MTQDELRARIRRMFADDGAAQTADCPSYWVLPTEKQKETSPILHLRDGQNLGDGIALFERSGDDSTPEEEWLAGPHPALGGKSPRQMLEADDESRDVLGRLVTMIEQGSFS